MCTWSFSAIFFFNHFYQLLQVANEQIICALFVEHFIEYANVLLIYVFLKSL